MSKYETIKKHFNDKWYYMVSFESNADMRTWSEMYYDMQILLAKLESVKASLEAIGQMEKIENEDVHQLLKIISE